MNRGVRPPNMCQRGNFKTDLGGLSYHVKAVKVRHGDLLKDYNL